MYEAGLSLSNECKPIEASPTLCYSLTRLERKRERENRMSSASVQALSHGEAQRKSSTRRKVLHKTQMHAISFPLRWRKEKREKKKHRMAIHNRGCYKTTRYIGGNSDRQPLSFERPEANIHIQYIHTRAHGTPTQPRSATDTRIYSYKEWRIFGSLYYTTRNRGEFFTQFL